MRGHVITRTCPSCGAAFPASLISVAKGGGLHCGLKCALADPRYVDFKLWSRVVKSPACWDWQGSKTHDGYGRLTFHGIGFLAHQLAFALASGDATRGLKTLHTCDRPSCVRNDEAGIYVVGGRELPRFGHLARGTDLDNTTDKWAKGRGVALIGEAHGMAKLTDEQVLEIRRIYSTRGATQKALAKRYGVSPSMIRFIVAGQSWTHLPVSPLPKIEPKIPFERVLEIRRLFATGEYTKGALAEMFSVSSSQVSNIVFLRSRLDG